MKKVLLLTVLLSLSILTQAQKSTRIAYIDMEYILENVSEYQKAQAQLEATVSKWIATAQEKQVAIDALKSSLDKERILLTPELIADREADIKILEEELYQFQQAKFGADGLLVKRKQELIKPIQDQVFDVVQLIRKAKKYDYVFDKSSKEIMMIAANDKLDISDQVLRRLKSKEKREDIKRKRNKKSKRGKASTKAPTEAQQKNIEARNKTIEARRKALEAKKAAALKAREERIQKAKEAREKKLKEREERQNKNKK